MSFGEHGDHVRSDLVGGIAVGGDAVGADDYGINFPPLHYMSRHVVGDDRDRNIVFGQLPCGQAQALQKRPRLVGDDRHAFSRIPRAANHTEGRAIIAGGCQSARITVSENSCAIGN